jgi:glutamine phosphoribosylpyrophosphate amidotransferase
MCGVFGFVSRDGGAVNLKTLARVAEATERRGPHAFGFAWIDRRGRLKCCRQTGRITDHLGLLTLAADARMLVGHCR